MTELKVECDCGQRFKFDVEPVNGRMPFTVNCPACGVDGTEKANALLQQNVGAPVAAIPITPLSAPISPVAATATVPPAPAPATGTRLRINLGAHSASQSAAPSAIAAPTAIAPPPPIAPMAGGPALATAADPGRPAKKPNFWMGMVGAFLGALVGAGVSFLLFKLTGYRFRIFAEFGSLAVGYLAGAGAAFLGKEEGSKELAGIAAIFALAGIIAAQYLAALSWWDQLGMGPTQSLYASGVKEAKDVIKQIPSGSDSEIRAYLVKEDVDDGDDDAAKSVSDADVKDFKQNQLPQYQALASGQMTEAQYDATNGIDPVQEKKIEGRAQTVVKGVLFLLFLNKLNIVLILASVGLAYRTSANA
jgi:hypothetical protein